MDVTWRIETDAASRLPRRDRARLPAARRRAGPRSSTAASRARSRPDAGDVQGDRRGGRATGESDRPRDESIVMSTARRVWITGIGPITAIGTGARRVPGRAPGRPLAGQADRPVRPVAVPLAGRRPGRRLRPARLDAAEDRPPARPVQPVRARRRAARARRRRAAAGRGRRRRRRSGSGSTSAARSAGSPTPRSSTSGTSSAGIRPVAPNLALAVFGGAAPANLGIALDVRGPILSTANSCASRRGRDRRGARGDPRRRDRRGDRRRRRGPAEPARVRGVRHHPGAVGRLERRPRARLPAVRRGARRLRHGRGRGAARARGGGRRPRARGAEPYAEVMGYGATSDAYHMVQPRADGREAAPGGVDRAGRRRRRRRTRSTTSAPTPRRRRSATSRRRGRSRWRSASAPRRVPVSGTKALYGHPLGASGAIEAAICALAIRDGWVPASANLVEPDPEVAALLPGLLRDGREGDVPPDPVDLVRVRRPERRARLRRVDGLSPTGCRPTAASAPWRSAS